MSKLAHSNDETMLQIEAAHYREEHGLDEPQGVDLMREANNEYFIASLTDDAEDALHIVREMLPKQRAGIKDDLERAADFIAKALLECR
jgi:hypothetical protein